MTLSYLFSKYWFTCLVVIFVESQSREQSCSLLHSSIESLFYWPKYSPITFFDDLLHQFGNFIILVNNEGHVFYTRLRLKSILGQRGDYFENRNIQQFAIGMSGLNGLCIEIFPDKVSWFFSELSNKCLIECCEGDPVYASIQVGSFDFFELSKMCMV